MSDTAERTMDDELELTSSPSSSSMQPIAGVSLELYARIVRSIEMVNHDLSMLSPMAALHGVDGLAWDEARRGWNARIATDPEINVLFRELYHTR
jgi:hypothetical protein